MNRRGAGVLFLITGILLYVVGLINPDRIDFGQTSFESIIMLLLFIGGLGYLIWGELTDK
jgi:Ca2+/Na+ antiporter